MSRPHSQGSSSCSSSQYPSPAHEGTTAEQEGLLSLDGDLYQVVKKLKEAKDKDEPISENQLLDLFFPVKQELLHPPTSLSSSPLASPDRPLEHSSSASSGSSTASDQSVNGSMGLMRMNDSLDHGLGPIREQGAAAATGGQAGAGDGEEGLEEEGATKSQELSLVLGKLKDVDHILEHLAIFWAQTEVILDVLLQKSDHVERFVEFAHKPRLLSRFRQRMGEYKRFWKDVQSMCRHFTSSVNQTVPAGGPQGGVTQGVRFYRFLEQQPR